MTTPLTPGMTIEITATYTSQPLSPGNGYEMDRELRCMDIGAGSAGYVCYATRGHKGVHAGYPHPDSRIEDTHTWPNIADTPGVIGNEYERDSSLRCADRGRGSDGYVCTARDGHEGEHKAWSGPGQRYSSVLGWPSQGTTTAGPRPAYLPSGAVWPPAPGVTLMYKIGSTGGAICSDCIADDDTARATLGYYSRTAYTLCGSTRNHEWQCQSRKRSTSGRSYLRSDCYKYGSRL